MRSTTASRRVLPRRTFLRGTLAGAAAGGSALLTGCDWSGSGRTTVSFFQDKPEVLAYFDKLIADFNASQSEVHVVHDSTPTPLVPRFVRGAPPDLACYNYNNDASIFVARGVLSDLSSLPDAKRIDPSVQNLVGQYAQYKSQTSVIPYSVTAAGVIYNKDVFDKAGVSVPRTWSELLDACEVFQGRGVVPIQQTFRELWTLSLGLFDYVSGGALDVTRFYTRLKDLGPHAGPDAEVSFSKDFRGAVEKMLTLLKYTNRDAISRSYADGNLAFAKGKAAMYFQGPWAIGEIAKINPKARVGTFALPATDDPDDTKVRVNLDLALWIPNATSKRDAALAFLQYLLKPEVMDTYNANNLAWSPTRNAPKAKDERIAELQPYVDSARFYQGASTYIPSSIPLGNYLQALVLDRDIEAFLKKIDDDWARYARRSL